MSVAPRGRGVRVDDAPRAGSAGRRRAAAWGRGIAVPAVLFVVAASAPTPGGRMGAPGALPASALCVGGLDAAQATPAEQKRARRKQWAWLHRGDGTAEGAAGRVAPDGGADGR